jgi:hypothetical protein
VRGRDKRHKKPVGSSKPHKDRGWVRDLTRTDGALEAKDGRCRNPLCSNGDQPGELLHGYCEKCWGSRIKVLPVKEVGGAATSPELSTLPNIDGGAPAGPSSPASSR